MNIPKDLSLCFFVPFCYHTNALFLRRRSTCGHVTIDLSQVPDENSQFFVDVFLPANKELVQNSQVQTSAYTFKLKEGAAA
jgi:hypothetical protein